VLRDALSNACALAGWNHVWRILLRIHNPPWESNQRAWFLVEAARNHAIFAWGMWALVGIPVVTRWTWALFGLALSPS
jgi:hypothetical protein